METLTQPTLLLKPFAENGDKNTIPVTNTDSSNPQLADLTDGFPPITALDPDDGGLPPERKDFNGLGFLTTSYDWFYQAGGTFTFNPTISSAIGGYPIGARLWYTDSDGVSCIVRSTIQNNTNNFLLDDSVIGETGSGKPWEVENFRGIKSQYDLFDKKWTDYELTDMNWLRADTFSWQNGTVYSNAYNHLVEDYNGGTSQTETVGSYTITYVLATDGHKITTDETNVTNIYNESGVAWYYILDTTNQRFKLPRENPAREELIQVIRAKGNGISLGLTNGINNAGFEPVSGLGVTAIQQAYGLNVGDSASGSTGLTNGIAVGITIDSTKSGIISSMTDSTSVYKGKKYLYLYIGQYTQSATEQTAGLNAELFNGKMDLDMSNMNPSQSAKQTIIRLGEPDWSAGVDIEVPVQATPYICPSDGVYVACFMHNGGNNRETSLYVNGVKTANCLSNSDTNNRNKSSISVMLEKNDSIYFEYGTTTTSTFSSTFYPLKGVTNA